MKQTDSLTFEDWHISIGTRINHHQSSNYILNLFTFIGIKGGLGFEEKHQDLFKVNLCLIFGLKPLFISFKPWIRGDVISTCYC